MSYGFYFRLRNNTDILRLPLNPERIVFDQGKSVKTYDIVDFGEIVVPDDRKLIRFSVESHFPTNFFPACAYRFTESPQFFADKLESWKVNKEILRFIITNSNYPVNILCVIQDFEVVEGDGDVGDLYYTLNCIEYRDYKPNQVELVTENNEIKIASESNKKPRASSFNVPKTYTVKSGDTLWAIAKRFLDDGSRYPEIASLNSISNVNLINVGQVLELPEA
jgi:LysM repeat protein